MKTLKFQASLALSLICFYNHTSDKMSKLILLALNIVIDRDSITKEGLLKKIY